MSLASATSASSSLTNRVFNFSAGPAVLPLSVLEQIQAEMISLPGVGSSVLEISHRAKEFDAILDDTNRRLRELAGIPDDYEILYLQGGAALQNAMVPANLITDRNQTADYIITGSWGKKSAAEVKHYGELNVAFDAKAEQYKRTPENGELSLSPQAAYVHLTYNETIQGVQFPRLPETDGVPLVVDHSSDIFCRPLKIEDYGLIYACAQKNLGIAGVTLVIMRKELLERSSSDRLPSYLNYALHAENGSRYNTPPTFAIYVTGLVCKWLQEEMGGLAGIAQINQQKSDHLYQVIDRSNGFYVGHADPRCRSTMNVVFKTPSEELDAKFLTEAKSVGLTTLKGHRSVGGIRASIYNAMPVAGVNTLADFMIDFAKQNG